MTYVGFQTRQVHEVELSNTDSHDKLLLCIRLIYNG